MSLTRHLVKILRGKQASESDLTAASLFVLDTLACAIGGRNAPPARMLTAVAPPEHADAARRAFLLGGHAGSDRLIAAILGLVEDRPVRDLGLLDLMRPADAQPRRAAGA